MTRPLDVVGLVELADLLRVDRATVRQWYHRGKLPEPDAVLAATPVWRRTTITTWARGFPHTAYIYTRGGPSSNPSSSRH